MFDEWITDGVDTIPWVLLSGLGSYLGILVYTRIVGLRSFSKMSAVDFAITVAVGSVFASIVATKSPSLVTGLAALATLYLLQWLASVSRRFDVVSKIVDNAPLLLMARGEILHGNLRRSNVTVDDLHAKLREANAYRYDQVVAVVLESTGDVTVLHADEEKPELDRRIFDSVVDVERLFPETVASH